MQIQISKIANGWLVMTPPKQPSIQYPNQVQSQQPQPEITFCANVLELTEHLNSTLED